MKAHGDNCLHPPDEAEQNIRRVNVFDDGKGFGVTRSLRHFAGECHIIRRVHWQQNDLRPGSRVKKGEQAGVFVYGRRPAAMPRTQGNRYQGRLRGNAFRAAQCVNFVFRGGRKGKRGIGGDFQIGVRNANGLKQLRGGVVANRQIRRPVGDLPNEQARHFAFQRPHALRVKHHGLTDLKGQPRNPQIVQQ